MKNLTPLPPSRSGKGEKSAALPKREGEESGELTAVELSKKYGVVQVLQPASFALYAGQIVVLSGPNGAGKTTLLSCLAGLVAPSSGDVWVGGAHLQRDEAGARRRLVFVPDVPRFYLELTAWEHLKFIAMAHTALDGFEQRAETLLRRYGLWEARDLFPHNYSRGMRLKLGLLLALIRPFRVLLLDEPTSALDVESVALLKDELQRLRGEGAAILLSSHDPDFAGGLADRQMRIVQGRVEIE